MATDNFKFLSDADLDALASGDMTRVSDAGLRLISGEAPARQPGVVEGGLMGLARGAKDVIDTGADWLSNLGGSAENQRIKAMNQAGKAEFQSEYGDSLPATVGRIGGNIAATAPVGGLLGALAKVAAPATGAAAPVVNAVGNAISTGGMRTGGALKGAADMGARVAGGAISGGASSALVDPESAGLGAAIGGALPIVTKAAGLAGAGIRKGVLGQITPERAALAREAEKLGIAIPADRLTDSKPLNAVAASLNYVPLSGRTATEEAMNSAINRSVSNTFGQDTSNVSKGLRDAKIDLGGKFDSYLRSNKVAIDDTFLSDLAKIETNAANELGPEALSSISKQIGQIMEKGATGEIDGQAAYNIKKTLDRLSKGADTSRSYHAMQLKDSLLDALNRSIGDEAAGEFANVRKQYGAMKQLERLAVNGAEGELSIARLANMKNVNNPELKKLADIAATFAKPREGQHGAAQRAVVAGLGAGLGGVPAVVAGSTAGRAANMALNSKTLREAILNPPSLTAAGPQGGLLGSGLYRGLPILPAYQSGQ